MERHLGGEGAELVRQVERYQLEIVGLTSTHSMGSGILLLEKGWSLYKSGAPQGEGGAGLLIAPQLSRHVVKERVVSPAPPGWGQVLTRPSWSPWKGMTK